MIPFPANQRPENPCTPALGSSVAARAFWKVSCWNPDFKRLGCKRAEFRAYLGHAELVSRLTMGGNCGYYMPYRGYQPTY